MQQCIYGSMGENDTLISFELSVTSNPLHSKVLMVLTAQNRITCRISISLFLCVCNHDNEIKISLSMPTITHLP